MRIDISHFILPDNFHRVTDFYIPEDNPLNGLMYPGPRMIGQNTEYVDIVNFMLSEAKKRKKIEFALDLVHDHTKVLFRGHSIQSIEGKVYIFRRLPSVIPNIESIGMPNNILELLTHERLNHGGLVIISGETGQGKSTTAASMIAYRLKKHGSFCLTIEDPVEMPLQGFYAHETDERKQGVCFQTNVEGEDGVFDAIKSSLRCYPAVSNSILFLGETRDALMASEVLKIAANGHLVVTTLHASDLMTSLKRFLNLAASYKNNSEAEVKSMFASVFRLLIHQRLEMLPNGKRRIKPQILFSGHQASPISSRIRSGSLELLATEIQNQNAMIAKGASIVD